MALPRLTLLVPNYNRPAALARLLGTVFASIDAAGASDQVRVLVVDDHSTEDIAAALAGFRGRTELTFERQAQRCGNAETAFLAALERVESEYTWLLGNDDVVSLDAVARVLRLLRSDRFGLVLLTPSIVRAGRRYEPLKTSTPSVIYDEAADLFADFGFVTSTTTFPCLILRTAPVVDFHRRHALTQVATVYAHTFTLFGALRNEPALLFGPPLVGFTFNALGDERAKLERQSPGVRLHHQTVGLARLIGRSAKITGVPVARLGAAQEDEINKTEMTVEPTTLAHYLTGYVLEQLGQDLAGDAEASRPHRHRYLTEVELSELKEVITAFEIDRISRALGDALGVYKSRSVERAWKLEYLKRMQRTLWARAREAYAAGASAAAYGAPLKLQAPNHAVVPLRGRPGTLSGDEERPYAWEPTVTHAMGGEPDRSGGEPEL